MRGEKADGNEQGARLNGTREKFVPRASRTQSVQFRNSKREKGIISGRGAGSREAKNGKPPVFEKSVPPYISHTIPLIKIMKKQECDGFAFFACVPIGYGPGRGATWQSSYLEEFDRWSDAIMEPHRERHVAVVPPDALVALFGDALVSVVVWMAYCEVHSMLAQTCSSLEFNKAETLPGRLKLPTLRLTASRSNQLSYGSLVH